MVMPLIACCMRWVFTFSSNVCKDAVGATWCSMHCALLFGVRIQYTAYVLNNRNKITDEQNKWFLYVLQGLTLVTFLVLLYGM